MRSVIAFVLFLIFLSISILHFYWGFGGQWGKHAAVPTRNDHKRVFTPGFLSTLIVAFGLLAFAIFNLTELGFLPLKINTEIKRTGFWIIAIIFLIRGIGDLKYIGFFKKIRDTKFARNDTRIYSPLCLVIGILSVILALSS